MEGKPNLPHKTANICTYTRKLFQKLSYEEKQKYWLSSVKVLLRLACNCVKFNISSFFAWSGFHKFQKKLTLIPQRKIQCTFQEFRQLSQNSCKVINQIFFMNSSSLWRQKVISKWSAVRIVRELFQDYIFFILNDFTSSFDADIKSSCIVEYFICLIRHALHFFRFKVTISQKISIISSWWNWMWKALLRTFFRRYFRNQGTITNINGFVSTIKFVLQKNVMLFS